ncbi:hypothetical protein SNE40_010926 [Patella caerulea]|uniref:G-protein coupled receptors family 1 profile domain-containing protein n=1 Tax=Patella caerulea TaxID=87958 RepID=A0AAN8JVC1_PATCE
MEKTHYSNLSRLNPDPVGFQGSIHTATLAVCTVLVIFVLFLGCVGNGTVILQALRCKKLRSNFDLLVLNLAGADFILCTCLSPTFLYLLFKDPPSPQIFCGSFLFLGITCGLLSLLTIVAIAVHRQARVVGQARGTLTLTQVGVILGIVWILSLSTALGATLHMTLNWEGSYQNCQAIINSPGLQSHNYILFFISPLVTVSFIIIIISYTVIARVVQDQGTGRVRVPPPPISPHRTIDTERQLVTVRRVSGRPCPCCARHPVLDKENKAITMCLVVILMIILCWSPLVISQFVELATGESIILYQVKLCGIALLFLNSALDPYVYAQNNDRRKYRYGRMFLRFLRCQRRQSNRTNLRVFSRIKPDFKRQKSSPINTETNTLQIASPKQTNKSLGPLASPYINDSLRRDYMSRLLLVEPRGCGSPYNRGMSNHLEDIRIHRDKRIANHKSPVLPETQNLIDS